MPIRRKKIIITIFSVAILLVLANFAMAADTAIQFQPEVGLGDSFKAGIKYAVTGATLGEVLISIYKYGIGVMGILATIVMMVGGIKWMLAGGDSGAVNSAKKMIEASLTGLVVGLCAYLILATVNSDLVKTYDLSLDKIIEITPTFSSGGGLNTVTNDVSKYNDMLKQAASQTGFNNCTMLKAFMITESSGNPNAVGPSTKNNESAVGLMQLMPGTASEMGCGSDCDRKDPQTSINLGAKYLAKLSTSACGNKPQNDVCNVSKFDYIIAAYNGGPGANEPDKNPNCKGMTQWQCPENKGYQQTRDYVKKVNSNYNKMQQEGWGCSNLNNGQIKLPGDINSYVPRTD